MLKTNLTIFLLLFVAAGALSQTRFTVADKPWDPDKFGDIRAVVSVNDASARAALAHIEWRRRDKTPDAKNIIVTSADGAIVKNVIRGDINNEFGDVFFEPVAGAGIYYVYYLPYTKAGSANYPKDFYPPFAETADAAWAASAKSTAPKATVTEIQSVDAFNSFYPMEVIATRAETDAIFKRNLGRDFIVFPEDRMFPIRMTDHLPSRWVNGGDKKSFAGKARRGEFYAFQLGILAVKNLSDVRVIFDDLKSGGNAIASANMTCINTEGIDYRGGHFTKRVDVGAGSVQAIWCGVDVPVDAKPGKYIGKIAISPERMQPQSVSLSIDVSNSLAENSGFNEPEKQTRLKWLNSTLAQENTVIAPYTPIVVSGNELSILGRKITLDGASGLPSRIETFFTPEMTSIGRTPTSVLAGPMKVEIEGSDNSVLGSRASPLRITERSPGTVKWTAENTFPNGGKKLTMEVSGTLEFDGSLSYDVKLTANDDVDLNDIRLRIPFAKDSAEYMLGLGEKGRKTPDELKWKWDVATKNQDGAWLGAVNGGMQFSLRDEKYVRPLNTNFYLQKPLLLPTSWGNQNKGGIDISTERGLRTVTAYSGPRLMKKGDVLYYNFTLLITPFHPIATDWQWANRFYHKYSPIDEIKRTGATVINIHHATEINPYINYPFIAHAKMKAYIDEAHAKGLKVKIYNTVRELSNHAYELPALRSLGHEIYSPGKGGGFPWLQEHLGDDYIAAWFVPEIKDAAIVNSGMSRWHNYYVEGMNWLVQNVGIDGIYLDDVAFDRVTMKRIKRVLTKNGHPGVIDLHSANQFNKSDGFNNSALLYMEHFPYLNRLWFGEYFDYEDNSPDFFLTEVSGIPFGLMGEMLEKGGNPWRGMIYGMTNRMPWSDNADPRPLWKAWDDFGMQGTKMYGYWSPNCPVRTSDASVLATVYAKEGAAMIAVASWAKTDTTVDLNVDWKRLGIDPKTAVIDAPAIANFQAAQRYRVGEKIAIPKGRGLLLIVK
ncbi:MAG TPA: DUF6067 family protein [Pyrinomonadaceae bacterium]|nr:DUF6067 family protein [Pyrinomonadaceae bacterium]